MILNFDILQYNDVIVSLYDWLSINQAFTLLAMIIEVGCLATNNKLIYISFARYSTHSDGNSEISYLCESLQDDLYQSPLLKSEHEGHGQRTHV